MTEKRRGFTEEFKRDAVRLVTDEGYSFAEAGRSLGVRGDMIARWKRRFEQSDEDRNQEISDKQRIRDLEAEVRKLRMEKDILKKATAFFVQEKP
jgi:transposase